MTLLNTVRLRFGRLANYQRTKREIRNMPLDVALDLGIFREDARQIARQAVYG